MSTRCLVSDQAWSSHLVMWQHQAEPAIPQLQPVALAVPQPAVLLEALAVRAGDLDADQAGRPDWREITHAQVD